MARSTSTATPKELQPAWMICQCSACKAERINQQPLALALTGKITEGDCEAEQQRKALAELEGKAV